MPVDSTAGESGLDAYSRVVTSVAEDLRACVAALSVDAVIRGTDVLRGLGSGVVFRLADVVPGSPADRNTGH